MAKNLSKYMKYQALGLIAILASAPVTLAQGEEVPPPVIAGFETELSQWQAEHGASWRALIDPNDGHLEMLYGGNAAPPFQPDTTVDADWFALARLWVEATEGLHGIDLDELVNERVTYLPMGMANGTDKLTVRLRQAILGLPVDDGMVNALFDTSGRLLSLHSTAAPLTDDLVLAPAISGRAASATARAAFEASQGIPAMEVGAPMLEISQVVLDARREARLTYRVEVRNEAQPAAKAFLVDANSGRVLRVDELIHYFDVTGQIRSNATPGTEADHSGNPAVDMPMSYITVSASNGQSTQTDRDGNFVFPGVNSALDLTVQYNGTFNNVNNQAGSDYSITFANVPANQPNTLLMNPTPGQQRTAQANAYQHVNVLRDYIRDTNPSDNTADFKATSNPNLSSTCNAYFNGNSTNYYLAGGSCNNTAFSSVVAHEMGHWLNVNYGTGNGSDGMGEGNADMFGMYTYDDHIVGRYFTTSGGYVRSGLNNRQFCGDSNPGCHGGVHADGEVWMGAGWKTRRNLKNSLGTALGGATADQLFLGWMNSYNQTTIRSIIEVQWLTLDDNNGNIGDGTPNFQDIDSAFREQGFPGYDLDFFAWTNVTELPDVSSDVGPYTVSADVVALLAPPIQGVELNYSPNGGSTQTVAMSNAGGNTWKGDIPAIGSLGVVSYWLTATDGSGNSEDHPQDAPYEFTIGDETILYSYDFEAAGDQGWEGHLASDTATTGQWVRGDPIGTDAQAENDHTPGGGNTDCWFTGQGSPGGSLGDNDVDNGITTLRSPTFDLSGASFVQVSYWRWYSNDEGASPNADVLLAQLSNDDGATWTTVETVGPSGAQASGGWFEGSFLVDPVMPITSTMRVQFIAEDEPNQGSIIEAAIDDFEITALSPGCPAPLNYCTATPNSTGMAATMFSTGSQDVLDNSFVLTASVMPSGQFGLFFYGPNQASLSIGDGTMCIDPSAIFRLPVVQVSPFGDAFHAVDFTNLPSSGQIQNGDTFNFSFWFRDPPGGPSGFNFADGLQVTFCGN